ncbi:MAG: D-alanyl-D-alanine endopeptidase [Gammaproteobacteria bacterium]|nr:D-alanyl-D-alanine endopeptidase [Gammaproteobacteria bacterium]
MRLIDKLLRSVLVGGVLIALAAPVFAVNRHSAADAKLASTVPVTEILQDPAYQRRLDLKSSYALVVDESTGARLYSKNAAARTPIASLTKLMTAMVVLDAKLPMDTSITITKDDYDRLRGTSSRLQAGVTLTRREMLHLALMSSENRAASALARTYPGGRSAFIAAMNRKARALGLSQTHYEDSTGLNGHNVSTAEELAKIVRAAHGYALIKEFTTCPSRQQPTKYSAHPLEYKNTNPLVRKSEWDIAVSKTGYINEAGRCLVMKARIAGRAVIIVLLNSQGKYSGVGDATRIKKWIEDASRKAT